MALAILLAVTILGSQLQPGSAPRVVAGMLLLSDDPKVAKSARSAWKFSEAYDDVSKRFPTPRFVVRQWGKRSMIVIDLKSGPIGSLATQAKTVQGLVAKIADDSSTLDIGSLSQDDYKALHLNVVAPASSQPTGAIGLEADLVFNVKMGNTSKSCRVPVRNDQSNTRDRVLEHNPFTRTKDATPMPVEVDGSTASNVSSMHLFGIASGLFGEGMSETAKIIDQLEKQYRSEILAANMRLLKKAGLNGSALSANSRLADMPQNVQDALTNQFNNDWKQMGFNSQSDALGFLQTSDSLQITTDLGFKLVTRPNDPNNHIPGTGAVAIFSSVPGGISP